MGITFFSASPESIPLTKLALDSFTKENGYEKCLNFLSTDNKKSLLFACFKKLQKQVENEPTYYFYNGYGWKYAMQLTRKEDSNKVLVVAVDSQKAGEVQDRKNELKNLNNSFSLDDCDYYNAEGSNKLHCFNGVSLEETMSEESFEDMGGLAQIELKEFQEESSNESH